MRNSLKKSYFFEMRVFFGSKMNNCNKYKNTLPIYRFAEWIGYAHTFPLYNDRPSPMRVDWKLWEE